MGRALWFLKVLRSSGLPGIAGYFFRLYLGELISRYYTDTSMKVTFLQKRGSDGVTMKVFFLELEQHLKKRYLES